MKTWFASIVLVVQACAGTISRDAKTYTAELDWYTNGMLQGADYLETLLAGSCDCREGAFTDPACQKAANHIQVVRARARFHRDMALHNAGIHENKPNGGVPPVIPPGDALCL